MVMPSPGTRNAVWRARDVRSASENCASRMKICRSAQYRTRVPVTPLAAFPTTRSTLPDTNGSKGASGDGGPPGSSAKMPGSPRWNDMA